MTHDPDRLEEMARNAGFATPADKEKAEVLHSIVWCFVFALLFVGGWMLVRWLFPFDPSVIR